MLHIDFETHSTLDLKKVGVYRYAESPDTDVWCAAYSLDDGPVLIWLPGDPCPDEIINTVRQRGQFIAHNAQFERVLWRAILTPRYGWPVVDLSQWQCTMAMALAMSLPAGLGNAAAAVGLEHDKDMKGHRLMLQMCKPRRIESDGSIIWWDDDQRKQRLFNYCAKDVEVERALYSRLLPLSKREQSLWVLDQQINDRGVQIDLALVASADTAVADTVRSLDAKIKDITDGSVQACTNVSQLIKWLREQGVQTDSVSKEALFALSSQNISDKAKAAIKIRQEAAKSSTAKLKTMRIVACDKGRAHGLFQYHAASTGRWGGRLIQLQNLPRPDLENHEIAQALELINNKQIDLLDMVYGPPMTVIASCLRAMITGQPGYELMAADFSAIEARVIAWLAGEEKVLSVFRGEGNIYEHTAAGIYDMDVNSVTKEQRFVGKVACIAEGELVLTDHGLVPIEMVTVAMKVWDGIAWVSHDGPVFQGFREVIAYDGLTATEDHCVFTAQARQIPFEISACQRIPMAVTGVGSYAIRISGSRPHASVFHKGKMPVWDLLNAGPRNRFTVSGRLVHNCLALGYQGGVAAFQNMAKNYDVDISDEKAEEIKVAWRKANPSIVRFWHRLENAAIKAVRNPRAIIPVNRTILFRVAGSFLWCRLPSGRTLCYPYPKIQQRETPWGQKKPMVVFKGVDAISRKWGEQHTYGGKLAENITQAVARDLLAEAMFRVEAAGYPIVLTCHDEIVSEVRKGFGSLDEFVDAMCVVPEWASGLPLAADGYISKRYRK